MIETIKTLPLSKTNEISQKNGVSSNLYKVLILVFSSRPIFYLSISSLRDFRALSAYTSSIMNLWIM